MNRKELTEVLNQYRRIHEQYRVEFMDNDGRIDSNEQQLLDDVKTKIDQVKQALDQATSIGTKSGGNAIHKVIQRVPDGEDKTLVIINAGENSGIQVNDKVKFIGSPFVGCVKEIYEFRAKVVVPEVAYDDRGLSRAKRVKVITMGNFSNRAAGAHNKKVIEERILAKKKQTVFNIQRSKASGTDDTYVIISTGKGHSVKNNDKVEITGTPFVGYVSEVYSLNTKVVVPNVQREELSKAKKVKIIAMGNFGYGKAGALNTKLKEEAAIKAKEKEEKRWEEEELALEREETAKEEKIEKSLKEKGIDPHFEENFRLYSKKLAKTLTKEQSIIEKILSIVVLIRNKNSLSWGQAIDTAAFTNIRNSFIDGGSSDAEIKKVDRVIKRLVAKYNSKENPFMHSDLTDEEKASFK